MNAPVAIFVKNLENGGAEKQAALLARSLAASREVHFIVFNAKRTHQRSLDLVSASPGVRYVAFEGPFPLRFARFVRHLRRHRIALVFSYLTAANTIACLAKPFCRIKVCTGVRNARLPFFKRLADGLLTWMGADSTVVNCHSGKEFFGRCGFNRRKLVVIPNCIETVSPPVARPPAAVPRIVTVGRFVPQKDYSTALRAVRELDRRGIPFAFDIVGHGPGEAALRREIARLGLDGRTEIHVNPPDIPGLLRRADIYLSTSLFEGTSNSIMEAMNADLPVVATDVGDNSRLVHGGVSGFLCPPRDAHAIAGRLAELLASPSLRAQFGREGKRILAGDFSPHRFLLAYQALADHLAGHMASGKSRDR
jgi:glycosyltransferase involved in cell wall biosynthesis